MELVHGLALDLVRNRRESARFGESGGQRVPRVPAGTARMRAVRDCRPVHASAAPGPLRRKLTGSLGHSGAGAFPGGERRCGMRWLLIVAVVLLAGTAGTARAGEAAYKFCGHPSGERAGYSLNAHTPCWLVDRANRVVSSREIESGVVSFRISVLRSGGKARYQLTCDPWGGFDGLRFVTCRDRPHGFLMRFREDRQQG